jgi:hypothetical protein
MASRSEKLCLSSDEGDENSANVTLEEPPWGAVRAAIEALDGLGRTGVHLTRGERLWLAVGGGLKGRYLVMFTDNNPDGPFFLAVSQQGEEHLVEIVVGGQPGHYAKRHLVNADDALEAARAFYTDGVMSPMLSWEQDD